jgi:hypothetical protein
MENYLASSIEQHDKWWGRMIYYPILTQIPIIPHFYDENDSFSYKKLNFIKESEKEKESIDNIIEGSEVKTTKIKNKKNNEVKNTTITLAVSSKDKKKASYVTSYCSPINFLTPHKFMRTLFSDYVIDGVINTPINVFPVSCCLNDPSSIGTDSVRIKELIGMGFVQRLVIGTMVEALMYKKTEMLDTSISDVLKNNKFKPSNIPLVVSYVIVNIKILKQDGRE